MKSVPKLIRRFAAILLLSAVLLVMMNVAVFAVLVAEKAPTETTSPYNIAEKTGQALKVLPDGKYHLSGEMAAELKEKHIWAILIGNDTLHVEWRTDNVPDVIPEDYRLSDIAVLSVGYLKDYPTYVGDTDNGIVVLGFPKDSFWKHIRASWDYSLISGLPYTILKILLMNLVLILVIYMLVNVKLLKSVKPMIRGIQDLSAGEPVHIPETGVLSEICMNINLASEILQRQQEQLRKKEMARANWIVGVSHDIRTPLSVVMGYAGQLESSRYLSEEDRKKAAVIVKQSARMKNLINDLNLASKLEYHMQPLMKKTENAVAIVRQVVVDFMNMAVDDRFLIEWKTDAALQVCEIEADRELLKRAVANLLQNSMVHNEKGCRIYVSVAARSGKCMICIEDNGIGASDEQIEKLNHVPHYMVCDANVDGQQHGLGLLIVRQIIQGHGGAMTISRGTYGGFQVTLTIPCEKITHLS